MIAFVVPQNMRVSLYTIRVRMPITDYRIMFNDGKRDSESYLVRVEPGDKKKPRLYWPRVKDLELVGE